MTFAQRIADILKAGGSPHISCPLCNRPRVGFAIMHGVDLVPVMVVLGIHDIPRQEVVYAHLMVQVRCPASSQPVSEVP